MIVNLDFSHDKNGYPMSLVECDICKKRDTFLKHNLKRTGDYKFSICKQCERMFRYREMERRHHFTLLSNIPHSTKEISEWKCQNGHILMVSYNLLRNWKACRQCRQEELQIRYKQMLTDLNYTIIGEFPEFTRDKTTFLCSNGHTWITTLQRIGSGSGCHYCRNYWKVTPSVYTKEELDIRRWSNQYKNWRQEVHEICNFTCQICGRIGGRLHAHHLNGYNWDIENRFNPLNGVSLCISCHRMFHSLFGKKDNTKEQFLQFKQSQLWAGELETPPLIV